MIESLPDPTGRADEAESLGNERSAGAMLKAARERQGLHLAVLAATIKVAPAKLEALENDRLDQLPNATFARALAQSVCRSLKIDPRPVLALLPLPDALPLEGSAGRLNMPFDDRPGRSDAAALTWTTKPLFWAGGLLLAAAVLVALLPADWVEQWRSAAINAPSGSQAALAAASAAAAAPVVAAVAANPAALAPPAAPANASASASATPSALASTSPSPSTSTPASASAAVAVPQATTPAGAQNSAAAPVAAAASTQATGGPPSAAQAADAASRGLRVSASAPSWVEVLDREGRIVLSRVVQPGEVVDVIAPAPLKVKVGNVGGTSLTLRGQPVDLASYTRDNVARIELR